MFMKIIVEGAIQVTKSVSGKACSLTKCYLLFIYILCQKGNAAYKTYIVYGGLSTNISQTICHSLIADSWIMSSWGLC